MNATVTRSERKRGCGKSSAADREMRPPLTRLCSSLLVSLLVFAAFSPQDNLPALPSTYDHGNGAGLPYLPSASSAAYLPPSSYDQFGHAGVRSPPGSGSNYASHAAPYYAAAAAAPTPAKKKSSTPRRRAGADGEEPKPRKRKSVAGELNPDGTPATAPRARKPAAPKLDENGNPIPKKRRRKSGADGDDPATAGGSGGKKKGAAAASRKLQDAIGYGDNTSFGASAAGGAQWDASALAGVTRGSTQIGRAPSAFHKDGQRRELRAIDSMR